MSYTDTLTPAQKEAIRLMKVSMIKRGITNEYMQGAIIAVVSKETGIQPKSEAGYGNTSVARIREVFGKRLAALSDQELEVLKKDDVAFFNKVYGGRYGNAADEGYKYRGRGLNQLTFKGNYQAVAKYTDADIVANPDLVNTMPVAIALSAGYFLDNFTSSVNKLDEYNLTDMNSATNAEDAVGAAYHANAGWGKKKSEIEKDNTNGRKRAFARVNDLVAYVKTVDVNVPIVDDPTNNGGNNTPTPIGNTISKSVGEGGNNSKNDVMVVQKFLKAKGYDLGKYGPNKDGIDGDCGKGTIKHIKDLQTKNNIPVTGLIAPGDATWNVLAGLGTPNPTPTPTGKTISKSVGSGGNNAKEDVMVVQKLLKAKGYDLGKYGPNKDGIDGDCGKTTIGHIKDFQTKNNIAASGLIAPGDATMNALNGVKADSSSLTSDFLDEIANLNKMLADYFKKMQEAVEIDTTEKEGKVQSLMDMIRNILK